MSILSNTRGTYKFILPNGDEVTYTDWNEIPEDLDFKHIISFLPEIPPPPHTVQQHLEVSEWNSRLTKLMEIERARSN